MVEGSLGGKKGKGGDNSGGWVCKLNDKSDI